jgi:diguanylate cyclase (GGDEF)-like protein
MRLSTEIAKMFAALNATNEAILRTTSQGDLYQRVCDAAVNEGKFVLAGALLPDKDGALCLVAGTGGDELDALRECKISIREDSIEGRGLAGTAFRTGKSCVSKDYQQDSRLAPWLDKGRSLDIKAAVAVPILNNTSSVGVFLFYLREGDALNDRIIALMERMVENVSFALSNFERERSRERLSRMFDALSTTNEAILRSRSRQEMFQRVCDALAKPGKALGAAIFLAAPTSAWLELAAGSNELLEYFKQMRVSHDPNIPEGQGLTGSAFRSASARVTGDITIDQPVFHWQSLAIEAGVNAVAVVPLQKKGAVVGTISFFFPKGADPLDDEMVKLLVRIADNISSAMESLDLAEEKAKDEERIRYLASYDTLTGLPNRANFSQMLQASVERSRSSDRKIALLFIDLDRFKIINDSLGHTVGDSLLVEIGNRLTIALRAKDKIARLGGDEFVIVLEDIADREHAADIARSILSCFSQSFDLDGHECRVTASIGIAMFPEDGCDGEMLTRKADLAMYLAKEQGKNGFQFFNREISVRSADSLTLESYLSHALERGQFVLHYQPKRNLSTQLITGVEALLRWNHPTRGMVSPAEFIPLAEETGLIIPVGAWALKQACAQGVAWQLAGLPPMPVAVNLSPRQFSDHNILKDIDEALSEGGLHPSLLQVEITESMVMQNVAKATQTLLEIRRRGVQIAIDDFGTGYSSMSLMKKFPIDTIKIDRSFICDLPGNEEDKAIINAIIGIGKALGLKLVAEGVETEAQEVFLRTQGCDEMQGYLFSKPLPADRIRELFAPWKIDSPPIQAAMAFSFAEMSPNC